MIIMLICVGTIITACSENEKTEETDALDSTETTAAETKETETETETETTAEEVYEQLPITLSWVQWEGGDTLRPDGSACLWKWEPAKALHVNRMSVYYSPKEEDGNNVNGVADTKSLAALLEEAKYDIEQSAEAGIKIIGYVDTVQVDEEVAARMGYTLDQLCVKTVGGERIFNNVWTVKGTYIACINSPQWRAWQTEVLRLTAEAGFAGMQYDLHPYMAAGLFCQCDNCKKSWAEYSNSVLGREEEMPKSSIDFETQAGREYYKWKMKCLTDFMNETASEARKIDPDFIMIMNNNVNCYSFAFESLSGAWNEPSSEHHSSGNGYSSTLYMYQLTEALGFNELYTQYNMVSEVTPSFRYKINLGEAYSVIGGLTYFRAEDIGDKMFEYLYSHQDIYGDNTASGASAAVLYSSESNLFSMTEDEVHYGSQLFSFSDDRARRAASALLKTGVCYDYLAVERDGAADRLSRYDLLVLPAYRYFNDDVWKPSISEAVKNGKRIVAVGDDCKKYLESLGLPDDADIVFVPDFKHANSEEFFNPGYEFSEAVADTDAAKKLVLQNNNSNTAATIRVSDKNHTYIHIVRRGGDAYSESLYQSLSYTLPEGKTVSEVTVLCPFTENYTVNAEWNVDKNVLDITTGDFDTYAVICVVTK